MQTWANPLPVAVVLVPVHQADRVGLLVVRRAVSPVGKLALVGGYVEEHESWQVAASRELREEAGVIIDPVVLEPFWFASSEPRPNRLLLFSVTPPVRASDIPRFIANAECSARGLIFGVEGDAGEITFPLHAEAARRFFAGRGERRPFEMAEC